MRLSSIMAPLACLGALVDAALTTVEFDLVFPRDNVSYAPTVWMPFVFSVKNSQLAQYMDVTFLAQTQRPDGNFSTIAMLLGHTWAPSASSEYSFFWSVVNVEDYGFSKEGSWPLRFFANWITCSDGPNGHGDGDSDTGHNVSSPASILFRTDKSGQAIHLLSTSDTDCVARPGFRLKVDDKVKPVVDPSTDTKGFHQCVTVMNVDTPGSDLVTAPCSIQIPALLMEEIFYALESASCTDFDNCPAASKYMSIAAKTQTSTTATATHTSAAQSAATTTAAAATTTTTTTTTAASDPPKNAAERVAMAGTAWLAAAVGVLGLLLA